MVERKALGRASTSRSQRWREGPWKRILRFAVTGASLAILASLAELDTVARTVASTSPAMLLGAAVVAFGDRALMVGKWLALLGIQSTGIPRTAAIRAYLASGLALYLLPVSVGADVLRALALGRHRNAVAEVGASIAAERILGLLSSALMSAVALAVALRYSVDLTFLLPWSLLAILAGTVVLVLPLSRRVAQLVSSGLQIVGLARSTSFLQRLGSAYRAYRGYPRLLFGVGALSVVEQLFPVATNWILARALGIPVDFTVFLVVMPLTLFLARLPISLGGVGVAEGSIVYLLGLFGFPAEQALAIAVLSRALDIVVVALPGAFLWKDLMGEKIGARASHPEG